jgi:hypothetical protein
MRRGYRRQYNNARYNDTDSAALGCLWLIALIIVISLVAAIMQNAYDAYGPWGGVGSLVTIGLFVGVVWYIVEACKANAKDKQAIKQHNDAQYMVQKPNMSYDPSYYQPAHGRCPPGTRRAARSRSRSSRSGRW